jgi:hypothetical protein
LFVVSFHMPIILLTTGGYLVIENSKNPGGLPA